MNKLLTILVAAVALVHAGLAYAAEVSGRVMSVDSATRTIVLEDGTAVLVPAAIPLDDVKQGSMVTIAYEIDDGKNIATDVVATQ